jgi:hypothetical protein
MSVESIRTKIVDEANFPQTKLDGNATYADIILAPADKRKYRSVPLNDSLPKDIVGHPRHWFALIPSDRNSAGLVSVEFGLSSSNITGAPKDESRFDHELFLDENIRINAENPVVKGLYAHIGGAAVQAARRAGDKVFATLEVQYGTDEDREILKWAQLTYSRSMLATGTWLKKVMTGPIDQYPRPFREAILDKNRNKVAPLMALSAFAAMRDLH